MYKEYWNLTERPFQNTPDPRFLYYSSQHKEALLKLDYAIKEKMGAAMLTGVFGCGKTVLAQALLEELNPEKYKVAFITHPQMDHIELLMAITSSLGDKRLPKNKKELLVNVVIDSLREILLNNFREGKDTVIILDEAHILEDPRIFEELRLLLNLQLKDRFLLTLLLIGQPELQHKIDEFKQLEQRIAIKSYLDSLDKEDTQRYILYRLKVAGGKKTIFTKEAVDLIYELTGGVPRRINRLCDLSLLEGCIKKYTMIDEDLIRIQAASLGRVEVTRGKKEKVSVSSTSLLAKETMGKEPSPKESKVEEEVAGISVDVDLDEPESQELYNNCIMLLENTFNRSQKDKNIESSMFISLSHQLIDKLKKEPVSLWVLTNKSYPQEFSYLYYHSLNTAIFSILTGLELDYDDNRLSKLVIAALMHDIGMCKVPKEIIEKKGRLTNEEYDRIKQHTILGSELLLKKAPKELNGITARVILEHHENLNGSGYPNKKFANQIVEFSKIVGLSNIYESLIHSRIYRPRFGPYRAMVEIIDLDEKGFFDKSLVKVFIQKFSFYPIGSWVKLNTDEIARVLAINKSSLVSPTVKIILDSQKQPLDQPKIVDLASRPKFSIKEAIEDPREEPVLIEEDISASRLPKELYQELLSKTKQIFKKAK